jgi:hypothetical protein
MAPVERDRRLLVLGAREAALGLLEAARRRRLTVIAADADASAPGFQLADRRALIAADDEPAIHRLAEAERIDAVLAGEDAAVGIAARVARRCALPHPLDPDSVARATSKLRQRELLAELGIPHVPWRLAAYRVEDLGEGPELTIHGFSIAAAFHELTPRGPAAAAALAAAAVVALGIHTGPTRTTIRIAPEGLQVAHVVARLAPEAETPLLADLVVATALGEPVDAADLVPFAPAHGDSADPVEAAA